MCGFHIPAIAGVRDGLPILAWSFLDELSREVLRRCYYAAERHDRVILELAALIKESRDRHLPTP